MQNLIKKIIKSIKASINSRFPIIRVIRNFYLNNGKPVSLGLTGPKRALVCYITEPFKGGGFLTHSNQREVVVIAETLSGLNFSVDIIDYNSKFNIDYSRYELIFGFGDSFVRSYYDSSFQGKRILHFTGANPNISNEAEAKRCRDIMLRKKTLLTPRREVYWPWMFAAINSDAIFILGNDWTKSTYAGINDNAYLLPVPYVAIKNQDSINKQSQKNLKSFCWFAGSGSVHKGLDLVLDAINLLDEDIHLDVCGPIDVEIDFLELYKELLFQSHKITYHGFVDVSSKKMEEIVHKNTFVIFPSCSEGGGSSVITCMDAGLIPIVTKESSVNLDDFGIAIESLSIDALKKAMTFAILLDSDEISRRSARSSIYAKSYHSYEHYQNSLRNSIIQVFNKL